MMMKNVFYRTMLALVTFLITFSGCSENTTTKSQDDNDNVTDHEQIADNDDEMLPDGSQVDTVYGVPFDDDFITDNEVFVDDDEPVAEYGAPHVDYSIDGVVTDDAGKGLADIEVSYTIGSITGKTKTNANGEWSVLREDEFPQYDTTAVTLKATDVDGAANGGFFEQTEVKESFVCTDNSPSSWDEGICEKHGIKITMEQMPATDYGPIYTEFDKKR